MIEQSEDIRGGCYWKDLLNDEERNLYYRGVLAIVLLSILAYTWFICQKDQLFPKPKINKYTKLSYDNLNLFYVSSCCVLLMLIISLANDHNTEDTEGGCYFFGFLETFVCCMEIEILTHVCIERYVVARYTSRGWKIVKSHYKMFVIISASLALTYSLAPFAGLGSYGLGFSCTRCGYSIVLPNDWRKYVVVIIHLLRSVKPVAFMIGMLNAAYVLERNYNDEMKKQKDMNLTKVVELITLINLCAWAPNFFIKAWFVVSQLLYNEILWKPPMTIIRWTMLLSDAAPFLSVTIRFAIDWLSHCGIMFREGSTEDQLKDVNETKELKAQ